SAWSARGGSWSTSSPKATTRRCSTRSSGADSRRSIADTSAVTARIVSSAASAVVARLDGPTPVVPWSLRPGALGRSLALGLQRRGVLVVALELRRRVADMARRIVCALLRDRNRSRDCGEGDDRGSDLRLVCPDQFHLTTSFGAVRSLTAPPCQRSGPN